MIIFPAIDLYGKKAVRLYKGDYNNMTVYSDNPPEIASDFKKCGAEYIHIVDLEGAKEGKTPNFETVVSIKKSSGLFCEVGGGIRDINTVKRYIDSGIDRVILGTAAVTDEGLLNRAVSEYGEKIAVGIDDFCKKMQQTGVETIICTDISKDGAMKGTNCELYRHLCEKYSMRIVASGGVSSLEDVKMLSKLNLYGAIIGKAYYTGAVDLKKAVEVAEK